MSLALELHMTLNELWERMTPAELQLWGVYFQLRAEDRDRQ